MLPPQAERDKVSAANNNTNFPVIFFTFSSPLIKLLQLLAEQLHLFDDFILTFLFCVVNSSAFPAHATIKKHGFKRIRAFSLRISPLWILLRYIDAYWRANKNGMPILVMYPIQTLIRTISLRYTHLQRLIFCRPRRINDLSSSVIYRSR